MKYIVVLGDGMADYPVPAFNGKTPLEVANKPSMDYLARHGEYGLAITVPPEMAAGSDTANLSIMGYNPRECYSGRSPIEAVSIGVKLAEDDVATRCNMVTISTDKADFWQNTMVDYSAGDIETETADKLLSYLREQGVFGDMEVYTGTKYRHCLITHHSTIGTELTPPHDISGEVIGPHKASGLNGDRLNSIMQRAYELLNKHPINAERVAQGLPPANCVWFWGEGTKPKLTDFYQKTGKHGAVISAVDLVKGIGICAGLKVLYAPGMTGYIDTNFRGKAMAAVQALKDGLDYVYIHMECADECGHKGEPQLKVQAIESMDKEVVKVILEEMDAFGEPYSILLCPDHPTPIVTRTHSHDAIPYVIYRSNGLKDNGDIRYTEQQCKLGEFVENGYTLIDKLFAK